MKGEKSGVIRGKVWPRDEKEPAAWNVELTDSRPVLEGSAALYGYVLGNFNDKPGTEIYYDNLRITPNKGTSVKKVGAVPPAREAVPAATVVETYYYPLQQRRGIFPLFGRWRR
jgi:hypothetical protein